VTLFLGNNDVSDHGFFVYEMDDQGERWKWDFKPPSSACAAGIIDPATLAAGLAANYPFLRRSSTDSFAGHGLHRDDTEHRRPHPMGAHPLVFDVDDLRAPPSARGESAMNAALH